MSIRVSVPLDHYDSLVKAVERLEIENSKLVHEAYQLREAAKHGGSDYDYLRQLVALARRTEGEELVTSFAKRSDCRSPSESVRLELDVMTSDRCGKCANCEQLSRVAASVFACCNPPFSHADQDVVDVWNEECERLPCLHNGTQKVEVSNV